MRNGFYLIGLFILVLILSAAISPPPAPQVKKGEILVKFKSGISALSIDTIYKENAAEKIGEISVLGIHLVRLAADADLEKTMASLRSSPQVLYAEPNYVYHALLAPNDPLFSDQWALENSGQESGLAGADINALEGWEISTGSDEVIVGILDTGIDITHEDLMNNIYTNPGEDVWGDPLDPATGNGVDDDGNGKIDDWKGWNFVGDNNDLLDDNMHGTHCAGIAGAIGNNGKGVAGVNWSVRIMPLKFLSADGAGSTYDGANAIIYAADMGVDVINASWGGGSFSTPLEEAIRYAHERGVLFVAAAGNNGLNTDEFPEYPACYEVPNVISVAATDREDKRAIWGSGGGDGGFDDCGFVCSNVIAATPGSNYGPSTVDLAAPGDEIKSTTPGGAYTELSGTSMAAPYVAGAACLVLAVSPALSHLEVKERLISTVDKIAAFENLSVSQGRLNLARALQSN